MPKPTKQQIERQDFVDNQIFELMQRLLPPPKQTKWGEKLSISHLKAKRLSARACSK